MANSKKPENKVFVVGWTDYDNEFFDDCEITDEVFYAVAKEVREKKYLFGGNSHQDYSDCCPVMNNGRCARFSWRGWGAVIAEAYSQKGANGKPDIMCGYMDDMINPSAIRRPKGYIDYDKIEDGGKKYDLEISLSQMHMDFLVKRYEIRAFDESLAEVKEGDYFDITMYDSDCLKHDPPLRLPISIDTYKIKKIFRANSFEEVIEQADEYGYDVTEPYYGYDVETREELIEQLYEDYPREQVEKNGAILFRLSRLWN